MKQEKFVITRCTGNISEVTKHARFLKTDRRSLDKVMNVDVDSGIVTGYYRGVLITVDVSKDEPVTWISPAADGLF